jgi:rod shape-determining protein MreC
MIEVSWLSKHFFWRVVLISSLLSPFVLFSSLLKPWKNGNTFGLFAQELLYPLEYVWHFGTGSLVAGWRRYVALTQAAKENDKLKQQMNQLQTRILNYEEQEQEIGRLRKLLGFSQHYEGQRVVAEVVGTAGYRQFYAMRVSKGDADGIRVGMPVVTGSGVVGRVIRAGRHFSDVHILTDSNFYLDVLIQRTRVRGILQGKSGSYTVLALNQRTDVKIGDTLITSGIMGAFPKGLPVGKVTRISYESDNVSQLIVVEPWVDHRQVEEVVILQWDDEVVQKISESVGKNWLENSLQQSSKN